MGYTDPNFNSKDTNTEVGEKKDWHPIAVFLDGVESNSKIKQLMADDNQGNDDIAALVADFPRCFVIAQNIERCKCPVGNTALGDFTKYVNKRGNVLCYVRS